MPLSSFCLEQYVQRMSSSDIAKFDVMGADCAESLNIIPNFMQGINKDCLSYQTHYTL